MESKARREKSRRAMMISFFYLSTFSLFLLYFPSPFWCRARGTKGAREGRVLSFLFWRWRRGKVKDEWENERERERMRSK